jgi:hypothetical protein
MVVNFIVLYFCLEYMYIFFVCYSSTCVGAYAIARKPNLPHKCPMVSGFSRPNSQRRIIQGVPGGMCETSGECSLC